MAVPHALPGPRAPSYPAGHASSMAMLDALPRAGVDWRQWATGDGIARAIRAWTSRGVSAADRVSPAQKLQERARRHLEQQEDPDDVGLAEVLTCLAALRAGDIQAVVDELRGEEPEEQYAVEYEDWYGYQPGLRGFEKACAYEDFWKGGGREGEAESREWHDWSTKGRTWLDDWDRAVATLADMLKHPERWSSTRSIVTRRCRELDEALARYPRGLDSASMGCRYSPSLAAYTTTQDDAEAGQLREEIVTTALTAAYNTSHARPFLDKLLAYKADAAATAPIELFTHAENKKRKRAHEMAADVGLFSQSRLRDGPLPNGKKYKQPKYARSQVKIVMVAKQPWPSGDAGPSRASSSARRSA